MPKILRIINRFNLGGPTYNVAYLSRYLPDKYQTLLVGGDKEEGEDSSTFILENLGLKPIIIPEIKREINWKNDRAAYLKIKAIIEEFKPDVVHTHASKAGAIGRLAASNCKVPVVVHTFHGHVFHSYFGKLKTSFYKNVERYLAKKTHAIIAISEQQKYELTHIHKIAPEHKIKIIPLGFDLNRFGENKDEKRIAFRTKYLLNEDEIAVVIVGRLAPVKNHSMFIECINAVFKKTNKKVRAFIVGDGEMRGAIEQQAREANIQFTDFTINPVAAPLTFTSWITDIDRVLAGSDIVCLTSFNEGTPVSLIEAQAACKPIVSTSVGGIKDIVNPESAFLTDVNDAQLFSQQLLHLVENKEIRMNMGQKGGEFVKHKFHYTRLVQDMDKLYSSLLGK